MGSDRSMGRQDLSKLEMDTQVTGIDRRLYRGKRAKIDTEWKVQYNVGVFTEADVKNRYQLKKVLNL